MSHQAVSWALAQPVKPSAAKFILVALAHLVRVDDAPPWRAFSSVNALVEATGQDRKTVLTNLARLVQAGWLHDTGERTGPTKSVPVYELREAASSTEIGTAKQSQISHEAVPKSAPLSSPKSGTAPASSGPENGTASNEEAVPDFPGSSPKFPGKQSQISHEAVPNLGPQIGIKEEKQEEKKKKNIPPAQGAGGQVSSPPLGVADLIAQGVSDQVAAEFLALRKRKSAALTPLALEGIQREADSVGWTLEQALRRCVERGWQGFDASWVRPRTASPARMTRQEIADAEQQRFLQMVGATPDDGRTFDMGGHDATF